MVLLETKQISKKFGGNKALDTINLSIEPGVVHSLVGENGAGKSTLIKIMTGVYQPSGGKLLWEGKHVTIDTPKDAQELGINVIHQDRQLVPYFTGLENLFLNIKYPKKHWFGINWRAMKEEANKLKEKWGIDIPLDIPVSELTASEKTLLEILRAMSSESKLLILDEPTASLTDKESELLFSFIERLKNEGVTVVYISHRLEEVIRISDKVTVLTGGKVTISLDKEELSKDTIIHHMTDGQELEKGQSKAKPTSKGEIIMQVENLQTKDQLVKNVSFALKKGEVLGMYGLAGAGRTETMEAIYGLRAIQGGKVRFNGKLMTKSSPKKMIKQGIVMVPENRHDDALIMSNTIKHNMILPILQTVTNKGKINKKQEAKLVQTEMERFNVKATSANQPVSELSGGNQQKVVFGKALLTNPDVYICDEPTQAVDVMTRYEIHSFLKKQALKGKGVIFVSSDLNEILEVSDRVIVFSEGETVANLENKDLDTHTVLDICYKYQKEGVTL